MKKLIIAFSALLISQFSFGQLIQDNATIPVSVTLNSILRLQVKSGGNIQFVFNTMTQYNNGIAATPGTSTTFTVASSRQFSVIMGAEDANLIGVESGLTIPLAVIEYTLDNSSGIGFVAGAVNSLTQITANTEIVDAGVAGAADADRTFFIEWSAGINSSVFNLPSDVYVTNVFLNLQPRP